jgi:multimeric flavodoxin WrbA
MAEKPKIRLLGVSSSPRKGWNTDTSVNAALESARNMGDWVETEFIRLYDYEIKPCDSCLMCHLEGTFENPCPSIVDDMQELYPKLLASDVYLLGAPVYWGTMNAPMKTFLDRMLAFSHGSNTPLRGWFSRKVMGAVITSWNTHGGLETTIQGLHAWAYTLGITVANTGHSYPTACLYGGASATAPYWDAESWKTNILGARSIRSVAKRAVEIALFLKLGMERAEEMKEELAPPKLEPRGEIEIDWDEYYKIQPHCPTVHYGVPEVVATSKKGFEKYLEWMSPNKFGERKSKAKGEEAGIVLNPDNFRKWWLEEMKVKLISDAELYAHDPEFFGPYLKK